MSDISLSKAVRSNLLSLQNTASMMSKTQEKLATGNKVNSALDNPTNFFTAASLNSRANDLNALMDGMANGIQTLEAADNGLSSITKTVESMQSSLRQARQDKSFKGVSFELDGATANTAGAVVIGGTAGTVATGGTSISTVKGSVTLAANYGATAITANPVTVQVGSQTAESITLAATDTIDDAIGKINANANLKAQGLTASKDSAGTKVVLTTANGEAVTLGGANATGLGATGAQTMTMAAKSVDEIVTSINSNAALKTSARASNDNGKVRIENLLTSADVKIGGLNGGKITTGAAATGTSDVGKNTVRGDLIKQFNDLRQQLDRTAEDASFNGINLLRGDALKLTFNESGSSSLTIQTKDGNGISSTNLGIDVQNLTVADDDASLDAVLSKLGDALGKLRSQSSSFGSNLSQVQNRQDFTKEMINTLQTGAGNLTLADMNEEAANLLALQTRQSLSQSSLSLASQADQSVLQLLQ
ncbi:flagellin [Devosia lacusdianchii]|uniref:flagellin N-terminal helical domain-containing protein n=1 Tax=Devosia lacusdianchii TaxID=2917991 RepID=UPI001F06A0F6|nr:flagellin [Devosia sp. JXJ CY 41]